MKYSPEIEAMRAKGAEVFSTACKLISATHPNNCTRSTHKTAIAAAATTLALAGKERSFAMDFAMSQFGYGGGYA